MEPPIFFGEDGTRPTNPVFEGAITLPRAETLEVIHRKGFRAEHMKEVVKGVMRPHLRAIVEVVE